MIFPKWPPSTDERLLLGRVVVNRDPCRTADPECKVPLGPSPQAPPGCSRATCRSSAHGSPFDRSHHLVASSAPKPHGAPVDVVELGVWRVPAGDGSVFRWRFGRV